MATVEEIVVRIGANISDFSRNLQKANDRINKMGQSAKSLGSGLTQTFGAYSLAVGGALAFTVNKAADFDTAMRKAGAIAGATSEEFDAMRQAALDLGATTSLSASEVANAMTELAASGFDANQTISAMPAIISAAEASGEDLALVSDTVASALNAFGLEANEAGRVADILAESANRTAAGVGDMQYSFKYAAPVFKSLGLSMEELAASTGILVNAGMAGEQAGTTLRASLLRLVDPPKEAARVMEELGFTALDAQGNMKGISDIAGELGQSLEGMTEAQKAAALSTIFGTEAVSGMLTLISAGPAEIDEMTKSLENSEGASAAAAEQMKAGIGGALNELSGAFETLAIVIGDTLVPYVQTAAEWLAEMANKLANMNPTLRKFLVIGTAASAVFAGIIAVVGVFLTIIGNAITAISSIGKVFSKVVTKVGDFAKGFKPVSSLVGILTKSVGFLGGALRILLGPIGWVVTALVSLGSLIKRVSEEHEGFRNKFSEVWGEISQRASRIQKMFSETLGPAIEKVKDALIPFGNAISDVFSKITGWFGGIGDSFDTRFGDAMVSQLETIQRVFEKFAPILDTFINWSFDTFGEGFGIAVDILVGIINSFTKLLTGDFAGAWETLKTSIGNGIDGTDTLITNVLGDVAQLVEDILRATGRAIIEKFGEWKDGILEWFAGMPQAIEDKLTEWRDSMVTWVIEQGAENSKQLETWTEGISEWFSSIPAKILVWLAEWWLTITTWIDEQKEKWSERFSGWGETIQSWFSGMPDDIGTWLGDWWEKISTWFSEAPAKITAKLSEWWEAIKTWFTELPKKKEIKDAGSDMVDKVGEGAEGEEESFTSRIGKLILQVIGAAILLAVTGIVSAGIELVKLLIDGVLLLKDWAVGKIGGLISSFVDKIFETDWIQKGKDIITGLISGITGLIEDVKTAAGNIGGAIVGKFESLFKMQSPSRLTEEMGQNVIEGWINGMLGMRHDITRTTSTLAALMKPQIDPLTPEGYTLPQMNSVKSEMELKMNRMQQELQEDPQPAQISLQLGNREYETFVDDITETQERKQYTLKIFKGQK